MRTMSRWLPLVALSLAACSAEHSPTAPPADSHEPGTSLHSDLFTVAGELIFDSEGRDINDSGVVVGHATAISPFRSGPAVWAPPDYEGAWLPTSPGMNHSDALHVSNDGTILGVECASVSTGCVPTIWRDGSITHLTGLDTATGICPCDGDVVIGAILAGGVRHAAVAVDGFPLDAGVPDGFAQSIFTAIARGHIVGTATRADGSTAAFSWSPADGWVELPDGDGARVVDVNSFGDAIGGSADGALFWPRDGGAPTVETVGRFIALSDSATVIGSQPFGDTGLRVPDFWYPASGWDLGGGSPTEEWVAMSGRGYIVRLVHANGQIITETP